jgi:hypothetical protein
MSEHCTLLHDHLSYIPNRLSPLFVLSSSPFHINQPTSFPCVAAILRLSTKYMVSSFRQKAIEHFRRVIPRDLSEVKVEDNGINAFGNDPPHPFALVSLFSEFQLREFLPWAFYKACMEGFDALINGCMWKGTVIRMSEEDTRIALRGWKTLHDMNPSIQRFINLPRLPSCTSTQVCISLRTPWLLYGYQQEKCDVLEEWNYLGFIDYLRKNMEEQYLGEKPTCSMCACLWIDLGKVHRRTIWINLPHSFALPDWGKLLEEGKDTFTEQPIDSS